MDIKVLNIRLESNGKRLEVGKGKPYRLLNIEGIESGNYDIFSNPNTLQDGSRVTNKQIKSRDIMLECEFAGINTEVERRKVAGFFNLHNKGTMTIEFEDATRKINYDVSKYQAKLINVNRPFRFMVDLYCPDPFWKDVSESKAEIALWREAFHFPLVIPQDTGIIMGYREPSLIVNVINQGDVKTGMRIEFKAKGTLKNPSLFNINTREFIKINKDMVAGEKIIINTNQGEKGIVSILNGVKTDILDYIDVVGGGRTFLQLEPGDNLLRYDADDGLNNLEVNIYYNNNYLGV